MSARKKALQRLHWPDQNGRGATKGNEHVGEPNRGRARPMDGEKSEEEGREGAEEQERGQRPRIWLFLRCSWTPREDMGRGPTAFFLFFFLFFPSFLFSAASPSILSFSAFYTHGTVAPFYVVGLRSSVFYASTHVSNINILPEHDLGKRPCMEGGCEEGRMRDGRRYQGEWERWGSEKKK